GIAKILNNSVQFFNQNNSGISSSGVMSMSLGLNGRLWLVTFNQGVDMYNGSVWYNFNSNNSGLPDDFLRSITVSDDGTKWIGTDYSGLVKFDDDIWTIFNKSNSFITGNFIGHLYYKNNNLWISSYGVIVYNNSNHIIFNHINSGIPIYGITSMTTDNAGDYWFTSPHGLAKYSGELNFPNKIAHSKKNNICLFPNPANDILYFEIDKNIQSSFITTIYSISGKIIKAQKISVNTIQISDLQKGIYILVLNINNELIRTKFIKK
ncbi:MAG: T9SS type A sorting domain-containing protein, partial [Bacteroidales bacterium]|nr:T9SS type A sorting domain-containing protein [Bacteroidales bacterium]